MTESTADVLICGAGIAGIAAAYQLSVRHGIKNVLLVDERAPFSLTSDKSTECYRNWWPGPGNAMVALMNRSIDIIEDLARESSNRFNLNRRGYLFVTADPPALQPSNASRKKRQRWAPGLCAITPASRANLPTIQLQPAASSISPPAQT